MSKPLQIILGMLGAFVTYFPIATIINAPFHYAHAAIHSALIALATVGIQIIVAAIVMSKRKTYRSLGIGVIIGAMFMTLVMFLSTPLLGV